MLNAQLHKLILRHQQAIQFNINLLLHRTGRKEQVGNNGTDNTHHNFTTAFERKLRRQQRFSLDSNDDDQRRIA
ncbi:hypothetical protein SDC9_177720 [bioreactor metagenome]|uniref:Uncharacterized protein n=1 Tax=bioreactor metagenome TaxID=1076179 RepID=A0A645GU28_9ZZZZ